MIALTSLLLIYLKPICHLLLKKLLYCVIIPK
jgi:hypothetical protein